MADIIYSADFIFELFNPHDENGDSGQLLLATKRDNTEKYVVKHEFSDCACNEFMYHKVAEAMNLRTPKVKLIRKSKRDNIPFKFQACAIEFIEGLTKLELDMRNTIDNFDDYFAFCALALILNEQDARQYFVADNKLLKLDNTSSFVEGDTLNMYLHLDKTPKKIIEVFKKNMTRMINYPIEDFWVESYIKNIAEEFGDEGKECFINTFDKFAKININDFRSALDVIEDIYNFHYSEFYRKFIQNRITESKRIVSLLKSDSIY